ncbi:MAG: hypothetical protein KME64_31050 [Scytonematopsis contorta HA4267-MV1]|jgi:YHS domain-containing protein|nr:hypothetical protein [Scytonematopsis contorta HA4267-MV1]
MDFVFFDELIVVILVCQNPACGKEFSKFLAEFKRSEKLGRLHFCSLSCHAKFRGLGTSKIPANRTTSHLKEIIRRDDFSPFRNHLKVMKKSAKRRGHECSVTLADLKNLWEKQNGICPYTGWDLILLLCTTDYENTAFNIKRASVDRKDCSISYIPSNIQFVAAIANFAKNVFTDDDLISFCEAVYTYKIIGKKYFSDTIYSSDEVHKKFITGVSRDKYSPFRRHHRLAIHRTKTNGKQCTVTLEYLKEIWDNQCGRCVYTGWKLDNPETTNAWSNHKLHPKTASLDRIDSSLGYVFGNVQFVSVIANYAKRDFQEEELLEFCEAVYKYRCGSISSTLQPSENIIDTES